MAIDHVNIHISYQLPLLNFSEGDGNTPSSENSDIDESDPGDVRCVHTLQFHYACLYIVCVYASVCVCVCVCVRVCA